MAHINGRPCSLRGCAICSRRAIAEAVACFVKVGALSMREAKAKLRGKLSEQERLAEIARLKSRLAELEQAESEGRRRTDEDEPSYNFNIPSRADEDERRTDETEGLLQSNIHDWDEPLTSGSNVSRRKPEDNPLRGRDVGQRRSQPWPGTTGGAREAIREFVKAGILRG